MARRMMVGTRRFSRVMDRNLPVGKSKTRGIPHSADSVRNDRMRVCPPAVKPDLAITNPLCRAEVSPLFPQRSWMGHFFGLDQGVEFVTGEVTELDGGFFEAGFLMVSMVSDF